MILVRSRLFVFDPFTLHFDLREFSLSFDARSSDGLEIAFAYSYQPQALDPLFSQEN